MGNKDNLKDLAYELVNSDIDFVVSISTPSTQAAVRYIPDNIPIVFTYVTSPENSNIFGKRQYVSGLSDALNYDDYLSFVKELFPDLNKAGRIYNDEESNSSYSHSKLLERASYYDLNLISNTISSVKEIPNSYSELRKSNINTILIADDNTMNEGLSTLLQLAIPDSVRVIGDSYDNTYQGALASISIDFEAFGYNTGDFLASVILGENPDKKPVKYFKSDVISLSKITANKIGFTFPANILAKAKYVIE